MWLVVPVGIRRLVGIPLVSRPGLKYRRALVWIHMLEDQICRLLTVSKLDGVIEMSDLTSLLHIGSEA